MQGPDMPSFYGSVTVGERGQVVIPQAAREKLQIKPGDKILVLGSHMGDQGLLMVKAEALGEFLATMSARFNERLSKLESIVQAALERQEKEDETK